MRRRYTKENLEPIVRESKSIREVARKLGLSMGGGGSITNLSNRIKEFNIDTSHFTGQLWSKGKTWLDDNRIDHKYSLEEMFCKDSEVSPKYFKEILKRFIPYECSNCGNKGEWQGKELVLEVEHRNGNNKDNRLENLEFLCPNCHSQTETFRGRNLLGKKRKPPIDEQVIIKAINESSNIRQVLLKIGLTPKGDNYTRIKKIMLEHNLIF